MFGFYVRLCKICMKADLQSCNESRLTSVESREAVRFYNNRSSFAPFLELQSYRIKGVSLEIFPSGLSALTTQLVALFLSLWVFWDWLPHLTLMLNGCFLKLSQSISSVCVPGMSSRNAFTAIFLNPLLLKFVLEKKHVPLPFFFFFLLCFRQNHYIC